jgi:predicted AAA+ superfamily ATPase
MIRDILLVQKRELEARLNERYVEREERLRELESNLIKVIIGPRRAGKSFFAIHSLKGVGSIGYVNFDDERLLNVKDYDEIINAVNSVYRNPEYLLLDEIQNLERWELFVNRLQRQGVNLVITGSNSKLLSKELSTHLTGRHLETMLYPFSFREFLKTDEKELTDSEIRDKLIDYLTYGGYPEPLMKHLGYKDYLSTLFNSILYKDIVKRYKIRSVQGMEDLATYLISNITSEYSFNTLSKVTKCKSVHTVEKYLGYLEEAFLFFKLTRFSFKLKEQTSSNKKTYCIDNGFVYAKAFRFSSDVGKLYENAVAVELKRLEITRDARIFFWKSLDVEVDFIVQEKGKITQLIQVCYEHRSMKARDREVRALIKASTELKCKNLLVITADYESEEVFEWFNERRKIRFIPLWKWLLESR